MFVLDRSSVFMYPRHPVWRRIVGSVCPSVDIIAEEHKECARNDGYLDPFALLSPYLEASSSWVRMVISDWSVCGDIR